MATPSEVKTGMDAISARISLARAVVKKAQQNTGNAVTDLNAIPEEFGDVIATINGYGTQDAFEAQAKAELAKLTAEFVALVGAGTAIAGVDLG